MKRAALLVALLVAAPASAAAPPRPVTVGAQVDQTAIWVGDVLCYRVRVVHDADTEIVLDNFKKDLLPLTPFSVRDIDIRRGEWAGGKKSVEIGLMLATYETGKTELTIPPLPVYYFRHVAGPAGKESPVESVTLPAFKVGLRSTLVPARPLPREAKAIAPAGMARPLVSLALGTAALLALAGYLGWALWRRRYGDDSTRRLTREQRERIVQDSLARVHADVAAAGDDPRRAGAAVAAGLRRFAAAMFQIPATALTPEEIESRLAGSDIDRRLVADLKAVLARGDELHYGRDADAKREPLLPAAEKIMRAPQLMSL